MSKEPYTTENILEYLKWLPVDQELIKAMDLFQSMQRNLPNTPSIMLARDNLQRVFDEGSSAFAFLRAVFIPDVRFQRRALFRPDLAGGLVQCDECFEVRTHAGLGGIGFPAHACLVATGAELEAHVHANDLEGRPLCLLCFSEFDDRMHLLGHYLVHGPKELRKIGISDQLVLKYINERYPRTRDELPPPNLRKPAHKRMGDLLVSSDTPSDVLIRNLCRDLPKAALGFYENSNTFNGLCEPNHWIVM
jgi:hypothetical protein